MRARSASPTATSSARSGSACATGGIMTAGAGVAGLAAGALLGGQARGAPAAAGVHEPPADREAALDRAARRAVLRDQLVRDRRDGALARDLDVARGVGERRRIAGAPVLERAEGGAHGRGEDRPG